MQYFYRQVEKPGDGKFPKAALGQPFTVRFTVKFTWTVSADSRKLDK